MKHVAAVLSAPESAALPKVADFHTAHREVEDALRAVIDELRAGNPGRADLWSTLIELHQVQRELVEQRLVQRLEALDRVLLSQVKESQLVPAQAHFRDDAEGAEQAVEALREQPLVLEYPVVETELMRRRRATIVRHPGADARP